MGVNISGAWHSLTIRDFTV